MCCADDQNGKASENDYYKDDAEDVDDGEEGQDYDDDYDDDYSNRQLSVKLFIIVQKVEWADDCEVSCQFAVD